MARKTLAEITNVLGPECFAFVLKELKGALAKGYQLHVLSFTLHSLLVAGTTRLKPGDLDYCLPQIVRVIMDDIFGTVGEEKDAEGYVTSMKEVKNSKSYDSMELIAKITTISWLSSLVDPIRALLQQNLTTSLLRKVDELLRRISNGVAQNASLQNQGLLVFCYGLLAQSPSSDAYFKKPRRSATSTSGTAPAKLISNSLAQEYKIVQFSLDIIRNVLQKQEALKTPANITGLLPLLNHALFRGHESVKLSAIRLLHVIVRVPSKSINQHASAYLAEAVEAIKARPSTEGELAQAAIKLISILLRERRDIGLDETKIQTQVAFLLRRLKQDIGEPNRQGATFTFLRAVLSRKIMVPEIYDVLDSVAAVMVTSQARESRDLARGVYVDFLLGYPQGRARYSKQLSFLAKNLEYQYPEGRQCVLEVLHMLLSKIGGALLQEIVATFMVPLVMVLVNDDDPKCREMAGTILKELFAQANDDNMALFTGILQKWLNQDESPVLIRAALQCYSIYFGTLGSGDMSQLQPLLTRLQKLLEAAHDSDAEDSWERVYYSLSLLLKLCETKPDAIFTSPTKALWAAVDKCFYFPHNWVKLSAVKLIGFYLADFARSNKDTGLSQVPLTGSGGLQLTGDAMLVWMDRHLRILGGPVSRDLATQVVRNLVFLGRCLGSNNLDWRPVKALSHGGDADAAEEAEEEEGEEEEGELEEDGVGDEEEREDDEDKPKENDRGSDSKPAIQHMFSRLSAILRRDLGTPTVAALVPKTAALQLMAALCNHLSRDVLLPSLPAMSLALHHLTDPSIPEPRAATAADAADFGTEFQALHATAHEVLALLQKVVGTTELMQQRSRAREAVRDKREERRRKRRIDAVTDPARAQRQKRKKDDRKKVRRRERAAEQRGKRRGW
jgi:U3 small nucleolar RNA-associated protein 20